MSRARRNGQLICGVVPALAGAKKAGGHLVTLGPTNGNVIERER